MELSPRLAYSDLRAIYLMLGECCELGREPQAWYRRFHERCTELTGSNRSVFFDGHIDAAHGHRGPDAHDRVSLFGWPAEDVMGRIQAFFDNDIITGDPAMQAWGRQAGRSATLARTQLARDRDWYNSPVFNDYYRVLEVDHFVASIRPLDDGGVSFVALWRGSGDKPFQDRGIAVLSYAHSEMMSLAREGRLILPRQAESSALTPRQREVLCLVGNGLTEKEVAAELGLSVHTVHDHIKALHRILGIGTRGELVGVAYACLHGDAQALAAADTQWRSPGGPAATQ